MISLKDNHTALMNLPTTIKALEDLEVIIKLYELNKVGPAYCTFTYIDGPGTIDVQFHRKIILQSLYAQRDVMIDYLKTLGIE